MIDLIFYLIFIKNVFAREYKLILENHANFPIVTRFSRPYNWKTHENNTNPIAFRTLTKLSKTSFSRVQIYLEYQGIKWQKISSLNTISDKGKIIQNGLMRQTKQDFSHSDTSYFLNRLQNLCSVESRRGIVQSKLGPYLSSQVNSLVMGFIFGGSQQLPFTLKNEVKVAGISHVLSASGSNVSLILLINSPFIRKKFGKFFTTFITTAGMVAYLGVAGCTAPLLRASTMAFLALLGGHIWKRNVSLPWLLLITCFLLVAFSANFLTSVSFQLSVAAVVGILISSKLFPNRNEYLLDVSIPNKINICWQSNNKTANVPNWLKFSQQKTNELRRLITEGLQTTLSVQLLTLPIVVLHFGELSILAVVSNLCLVWLVPWIVGAGALTLLWSTIGFTAAATFTGQCTQMLIELFLFILHFFGRHESFILQLSATQIFCVLFIYFGCILILFVLKKKSKQKKEGWKKYLSH